MYNYEFEKNNEKIIYEGQDKVVDVSDKTYNLSVVVTNKNLLFFNNANKFHALNGRGMQIPAEYLLELTIPLDNINYSIEEGNTYINYKNTDIVIFEFELEEYI